MPLIDKIAKAAASNSMYDNNPSRTGEQLIIPGSIPTDLLKPKMFGEVGVTGLLRTKGIGYVYDEPLRDLSAFRQKQIFREMRDNDAVIGSLFFALEMILRKAEWHVEAGPGKKGDIYAEFVDSCMKDMSHTWEDLIAESVSMFAFGFSLFETVYKRRLGPDGKTASQYDDGLIGWRKHAPRAQESILYWIWDEEGGLQGAVQLAAPDYATVPIPINKLLLFRTTSLKNSPEGRSILRNCYRSWFFKRRIEEVEGIGIERDLCGIPVLYSSAEALEAMGGNAAAQRLVTNIRMDDQMGVVLPLAYDEGGNPLVKLELLKSAGAKQTDAGATIQRYNQDMLNTVLAGFVQLGQTPTGSKSLHMSATAIFSLAITAFMDSISAIINRIAIPRLMQLNKMDLKARPRLVPGEIGVRDLEELAQYVQQLSQSGITFFDQPTQEYLRKVARLPEPPEDEEGTPGATFGMGDVVPAKGPDQQPPPGAPGNPNQPAATPGQPTQGVPGQAPPVPVPGPPKPPLPGQPKPPVPGQPVPPKPPVPGQKLMPGQKPPIPGQPDPSALPPVPAQPPAHNMPPPPEGKTNLTEPVLHLKQALIDAVRAGVPLDELQDMVDQMEESTKKPPVPPQPPQAQTPVSSQPNIQPGKPVRPPFGKPSPPKV